MVIKLNIISFDLELNQAASGAKIIEIGACVGNMGNKDIIDEYTAIVNPNEQLEERIIALTGITQAMVDGGTTLLNAYEGMIKMAIKHDCLRMPLTWGCGDLPDLKAELPEHATRYFGRRELDAKTLYQCYQIAKNDKVQSGLAKSMTKLGLNFKGTKHRATDDAKNTFLIFCALLDEFKVSPALMTQ